MQGPANQINRSVESAIYLFNRAGLYSMQGQFEKAREDVEKARQRAPELPVPEDLKDFITISYQRNT